MIQYIFVCLDNITCTLTQLATRVSQLLMDGHWRWSSLLPQGLASPRYNNTVEQQRQLIQEETQQGNIFLDIAFMGTMLLLKVMRRCFVQSVIVIKSTKLSSMSSRRYPF